MTVEFGSAVPVSAGVMTEVMLSVDDAPVSLAATRSGMTGVVGGVGSMVMVLEAEVNVLPAGSVDVMVNALAPAANSVVGVNVQAPDPSAVTVPMTTPASLICTVAPASAVPEKVGVPEAEVAVAGATSVAVVVVSTTTVRMGETAEVVAPTVAVALMA